MAVGIRSVVRFLPVDVLAKINSPLDLESLRSRINIDRRGARDFFDALVALGLLERHENGCYANTRETSLHLDSRTPNHIGAELDYLNTQIYAAWSSLTPALRTGAPQSGAGAAMASLSS